MQCINHLPPPPHSPSASLRREQALSDFTGRKIAIDASMAIYQFLVAVRTAGSAAAGPAAQLTNEAGEVTSHLQGLWYRTLKFVDSGIKPVYVFDGKPPELKGGELAKRRNAKEKAEADLAAAKEAGDAEEVDRFSRRTVKMDKGHIEECKTMLRLMGMPVCVVRAMRCSVCRVAHRHYSASPPPPPTRSVDAPCEAEAQCAALAKAGKVYAAASEDMDTLTFGTPKLVRWCEWGRERACSGAHRDDETDLAEGYLRLRPSFYKRFLTG